MGGPVSPPPPASPSYNLGPVGSKPQGHPDSRAQQFLNLCNIFPARQVQEVMAALPEETDGQVLARKIIEMFPPENREYWIQFSLVDSVTSRHQDPKICFFFNHSFL